jgi:hypothetical protein
LRLLQEYNFISLSSAKFFATSFQSKQWERKPFQRNVIHMHFLWSELTQTNVEDTNSPWKSTFCDDKSLMGFATVPLNHCELFSNDYDHLLPHRR